MTRLLARLMTPESIRVLSDIDAVWRSVKAFHLDAEKLSERLRGALLANLLLYIRLRF